MGEGIYGGNAGVFSGRFALIMSFLPGGFFTVIIFGIFWMAHAIGKYKNWCWYENNEKRYGRSRKNIINLFTRFIYALFLLQ